MKLSESIARFESAWAALRGRATSRELEAQTQMRAAYAGALFNRLNSDWIVAPLPTDQELIADLKVLRTRSRELARNNAYVVRFLASLEENVVGPYGIGWRPNDDDEDQTDLMRTLNASVSDAWEEFSECVTVDGRMTWPDFSQLAMQMLAQDGELFVRKYVGPEFPMGFALQFVDPDLVDESFNTPADAWRDMREIRMSVEVDRDLRRVGYYVYDEPYIYGSTSRHRTFVPADQMLHIGRARRANQTRYVPWVHPVMTDLKMLDGLDEAELVASRTAAAKMGWLVQAKDAGPMPGEITSTGARRPVPMEASPGSIAIAPAGMTFEAWDPQHPTTAFAGFHAAIIRKIAAGLGLAYTTLANDPGDANFSEGRQQTQRERIFFRKIQQFLVRTLAQPTIDELLRTAPLVGKLDMRAVTEYRALRRGVWEVPGWDYVSPLEDVQAAVLAINNNLDSPQRVVGLRGLDFERDVIRARKRANRMIDEAGLKPVAPTQPKAPAIDTPPNTDTPPQGAGPGSDSVGSDVVDGAGGAQSRNGTAKYQSRLPAGV